MTFEIEIEMSGDVSLPFDYERAASDVVLTALEMEGFPYEPELSLLLTDDEGIQWYNKKYRNTDAPTDVLSFPMAEYRAPADFSGFEENAEDYFNAETGEFLLGDIILSVPHVLEQAEKYGHSILREYTFLLAHSMLHLFGYDHMKPEDAKLMEEHQERILEKMNITR